jgi:hypothetical protein
MPHETIWSILRYRSSGTRELSARLSDVNEHGVIGIIVPLLQVASVGQMYPTAKLNRLLPSINLNINKKQAVVAIIYF